MSEKSPFEQLAEILDETGVKPYINPFYDSKNADQFREYIHKIWDQQKEIDQLSTENEKLLSMRATLEWQDDENTRLKALVEKIYTFLDEDIASLPMEASVLTMDDDTWSEAMYLRDLLAEAIAPEYSKAKAMEGENG